ncbi:MAG: leucine-rich repeat domain-containing protein, partial [Clostridiales bacterium]|nr:leucine-rich repeat domain-containing protein [Clostridiales bacterium]
TVVKARFDIAPPTYNGGTLAYGDALPAVTTATRGGAVALNAGQALAVGTGNYDWTFTPDDAANYETETGTISLTVVKARFDIAQPAYNGGTLAYGDALPAVTTATRGGAVTLDAGQTLAVGTGDYDWTFTPDDADNYETEMGKISLTVEKARLDIAPPTYEGGTLTFGDELPTITTTTATKGGTLALDAEQTLTAGTKDYDWTFTPEDQDNYETEMGKISLTVEKAEQTIPEDTAFTAALHNDVTRVEVTDLGQGYEYMWSTQGSAGEWQDGTLFEGLAADTAYIFHARLKETDNRKASIPIYAFRTTTPNAEETFVFSDGTITGLTALGGTLTALTIPETIGDVKVTAIGDGAFYGCTGLAGSLTIPGGVVSVGASAFEGCAGFTGSLDISGGVESIGNYAFKGCAGFEGSLTISDGVKEIGDGAFEGCGGFTGNLTIPGSVESIGAGAFTGCRGFTGSLTIQSGVVSIGNYAFISCAGFKGLLTIPAGVKTIGRSAFWGCSGFTGELIIPNGVESIGAYAFYQCGGLNGLLSVPGSVTSIGASAFRECRGLANIMVAAVAVPSLGSDAFRDTNNCGIYVPAELVADYKNASGWSAYANRIYATS